MDDERDITPEELRDRVVYALMSPVARFARVFGLPLTPVRDWAEIAYYHEARRHNLKMKEMAELMQISTSKVSLLSKALKENFIRPEVEAALPRRIEFMLWAEPLSLAKIKQVLTDVSNEEINQAIAHLVSEGRIIKEDGESAPLYRLQIETDRRVWDSWIARIDALNNAMSNVSDAVFARFFKSDDSAFARTLTFHIRRRDIDRLKEHYEELFALVQELDAAAGSSEDSMPISLSVFWAEHDLLGGQETPGGNDE